MRIDRIGLVRRFITDPKNPGYAFLITKFVDETADAYEIDGSWFEQTQMRPYLHKYDIITVKKDEIGDWLYLDGDRASAQYGHDFRIGPWRKISEMPEEKRDASTVAPQP